MTVPDCRTLSIEAENRTLAIGGLTHSATVIPLYGEVEYAEYRYGIESAAPNERTLTIECED